MSPIFSTFLVFLLPLFVSADNLHQTKPIHRRHADAQVQARNNGASYKLQDLYEGNDFLDKWDFFTGPDPTHGSVNYQNREDAMAKGLAYVQADGQTVLAVDDQTWLPQGKYRDSVRISSKKTYNGGLFIADFGAMPYGCSVWPAWWTVGPNWPNGGEIDVLEGVHNQATNQYTLHTSEGCSGSLGNTKVSGNVLGNKCAVGGGDNTGCGVVDTNPCSYGAGFNSVGGGVYAHLWDQDGIKIWHFPRSEVPADVISNQPNPSSWGAPAAFWSSNSCDMASHFYEHVLTIDTTLCGDWAGNTYGYAGCPGTCADAVMNPTNFASAKWRINYIAVYQK